ncbi:lysozyme [Saccharopolyspora rectivirgula]|uniref:lysozyme n=1 Tax=Saccharopolyspora rectivirgula TaxID=28042 RepID=UPI0024093121|nr:lysozyme [Saccharopolyspora rectivirgula]
MHCTGEKGPPLHRVPAWRLLVAIVATVLAGVLVTAPAAAHAAAPQPHHDAPPLDPNDPHGAWAGYSLRGQSGPAQPRGVPAESVAGMDVSGHQGDVAWQAAYQAGARFAYVKATEGTDFRNSHFAQQYNGSYEVGMIRGAYHFALPDRSTGAEQAKFFAANGGGWSADGRTLPGVLDIEHNPYGEQCYGLNPQQMTGWIEDFSHTYHRITGRYPVIYTTTQWWNTCTGGADVAERNPLWVARYNDFVGELPGRWQQHTFWQYSDSGRFPGCQDVFNGSYEQLKRFAAA